jgi:oligogalacturonide lyase
MSRTHTRRVFLSGLPALGILAAPGTGQAVPSEAKRYPDPATEFEVVRLTDPAHTSSLPAYYNRAISHRNSFLVYTSDRVGAPQAYRMDLKTFESRQITDAKALLPGSLVLASDEKAFHFADGATVYTGSLSNLRHKSVYEAPAGFEIRRLSASDDTTHLFVVESSANVWRLRAVRLLGNGPAGAVESPEPITDPMPRPKRAGILYRRGGELWLTNYDGAQNHRLRVAPGGIGPALWSSDGRTVLYLNFPESGKALNNIREFDPDTNEDRQVANTSQYVHFGRNADSTVFVGASGSKASPYVLLLVRAVKRELALCEHRASDPTQVAPIFAPNSQRVFFHSDRHGKMAIYSIRVERLVEATES